MDRRRSPQAPIFRRRAEDRSASFVRVKPPVAENAPTPVTAESTYLSFACTAPSLISITTLAMSASAPIFDAEVAVACLNTLGEGEC